MTTPKVAPAKFQLSEVEIDRINACRRVAKKGGTNEDLHAELAANGDTIKLASVSSMLSSLRNVLGEKVVPKLGRKPRNGGTSKETFTADELLERLEAFEDEDEDGADAELEDYEAE